MTGRRILAMLLVLIMLGTSALAEDMSRYARITLSDLSMSVITGQEAEDRQTKHLDGASFILEGGATSAGEFTGRLRMKSDGTTPLDFETAFDGDRAYLRLNVMDPLSLDLGAEVDALVNNRNLSLGAAFVALQGMDEADLEAVGQGLTAQVEKFIREVRQKHMKPGIAINLFGTPVSEPLNNKYSFKLDATQLRQLANDMANVVRKDKDLFKLIRGLGLEMYFRPGASWLNMSVKGEYGVSDSGSDEALYVAITPGGANEEPIALTWTRSSLEGEPEWTLTTPWFYLDMEIEEDYSYLTLIPGDNSFYQLGYGEYDGYDYIALYYYPSVDADEYVMYQYVLDGDWHEFVCSYSTGAYTTVNYYEDTQRFWIEEGNPIYALHLDAKLELEWLEQDIAAMMPDFSEARDLKAIVEDEQAEEDLVVELNAAIVKSVNSVMQGMGFQLITEYGGPSYSGNAT